MDYSNINSNIANNFQGLEGGPSEEEPSLIFKMTKMTEEAINFCLKRKEWIKNPHTVDKLYLSNHGFVEISNLERFNAAKELFLGKNLISKITNVECLSHLSELNLSNNKIGESFFGNVCV